MVYLWHNSSNKYRGKHKIILRKAFTKNEEERTYKAGKLLQSKTFIFSIVETWVYYSLKGSSLSVKRNIFSSFSFFCNTFDIIKGFLEILLNCDFRSQAKEWMCGWIHIGLLKTKVCYLCVSQYVHLCEFLCIGWAKKSNTHVPTKWINNIVNCFRPSS